MRHPTARTSRARRTASALVLAHLPASRIPTTPPRPDRSSRPCPSPYRRRTGLPTLRSSTPTHRQKPPPPLVLVRVPCGDARERYLLDAVHAFFAERIFGPDRRELLAERLSSQQSDVSAGGRDHRRLTAKIADLRRRRDNLVGNLEDDDGTDREFRASIQRRFSDLGEQLRDAEQELRSLEVTTDLTRQDPSLLDQIPQVPIKIAELPDALRERLFEVFSLEVRYNRHRHEALIKVTVRADTAAALNGQNIAPKPVRKGADMIAQVHGTPDEVPNRWLCGASGRTG